MPGTVDDELLEHWAAVVRATKGLVDTKEDAEDCASAAVLQLLERGTTAVDNPQAFLVTVAKRRAVDKARSNTRARRRNVRLAGQPPTVLDVAEDVAARAEARWVAQVAQERLSPKAYRLLRLLADGHDIGHAAVALGISRRGAESLLLRARRTVRQAWSRTLAVLGGCVLARRLRIAAPGVTLAASALVMAADLHVGMAPPQTTTTTHAAPRAHGATAVPVQLRADAHPVVSRAATTSAPGLPTRSSGRSAGSSTIIDVRPPTGGRATVRGEERPGGSGDRVDTIERCLHDFRVTVDHIGC